MWNQPYLETCCRAALHRLYLADAAGRPDHVPDGACLRRLAEMGLCARRPDGRFTITPAGRMRHGTEIARGARDTTDPGATTAAP
ncbi:MAG TPA: hypothetical protein VE690_12230 [Rhodopila sp.]|nr:hypothetical protein [Rhodopila sp.]